MPESEPNPRLIELVAPGAGQGWKAVLRSGKPAVVHEIPVPPAEAAASVPRMQRLFEHRHPALSPVLAWGIDNSGLWVAVEPNEGTPLGSILTRGPLTPPAAAALGAAVLSGVAALHEAGIAMGGFGATAVRVTSNGDIRLAGHPAAAVRGAPSQSDLRADVRSSGMAVCAAFGVDPAGAPAPANIPPGLVVTMRSMASGAMGPSADRAQGALREMAAALLAPDRQMAAQSELATRAGGREVPAITPFLPGGTVAPPAASSQAPDLTAPQESAPAPAPSPFIAPQQRDETPVRVPASYDAPDRPLQTYPPMPAIAFPPAAAAPPAPTAPPEAETQPSPPPVPTWSDEPYQPPAASVTTPPAPAPPPRRDPPPARPRVPPPPGPPPRPPPRRRGGGGPPSERRPWLIPVAIAAVIVILLGIVGVIILANRGSGPVTGVRTSPSASAKPTTSPKGSPSTSPTAGGLRPVPNYGPASAAPVTNVHISTTGSPCSIPGSADESKTVCSLTSCRLEAGIYFSTSQKSVLVSYTVKFFDRCTGQTTDLPGAKSTTPASGYIVSVPSDHLTVRIPGGVKSGALVVVSQTPGVAASAPLLLGADSC